MANVPSIWRFIASPEGRVPIAVALRIDSFVIRNHSEKHRPAVAACSLAIGAAEEPGKTYSVNPASKCTIQSNSVR